LDVPADQRFSLPEQNGTGVQWLAITAKQTETTEEGLDVTRCRVAESPTSHSLGDHASQLIGIHTVDP
jgi:hypothetical protein